MPTRVNFDEEGKRLPELKKVCSPNDEADETTIRNVITQNSDSFDDEGKVDDNNIELQNVIVEEDIGIDGGGDDDDNGGDDNGGDDESEEDSEDEKDKESEFYEADKNDFNEEDESEDDGEEDQDESDGDNDRDPEYAIGDFSIQRKKRRDSGGNRVRMAHARRTVNVGSPNLYPQTKTPKKGKKATTDELNLWKNESLIAMSKATHSDDLLVAYMLLGGGKNGNPWQTDMSLFFMVAYVLDVNPYNIILGESGVKQCTLQLSNLVANNWRLPKIPNMGNHLKVLLAEVHRLLVSSWDTTKLRIETTYTTDGVETVSIPDCPDYTKFQKDVYKGRNHLWKIWWGHEDCVKKDVRGEIIVWATQNLMSISRNKEFLEKIHSHWENGLAAHQRTYAVTLPKGSSYVSPPKIPERPVKKADTIKPGGITKRKGKKPQLPLGNKKSKVASVVESAELAEKTEKEWMALLPFKLGELEKPKGFKSREDLIVTRPLNALCDDRLIKLYQTVLDRDPVLAKIIKNWCSFYHNIGKNCFIKLETSLDGINRSSVQEIFGWYHSSSQDTAPFDLKPPGRSGPNNRDYLRPSDEFIAMGKDVIRLMNILLVECHSRGVRITRWFWEYHLMKGMDQLKAERADPQMRMRGMYVCLVLSAASTDFSCIDGTIQLYKKGLLDSVDALADSDLDTIISCIKGCGIHNVRAKYLKNGFDDIRKKHNGIIPHTMEDLRALPGVGRKTATLLLNEGYGLFTGIGTDKHVCNVALALGLFDLTHGLKSPDPSHVEASLRQWIPQCDFKDINKIFGGMAQLFTQMLTPSSNDMDVIASCISARFSSPYEIELVWFIVNQIRKFYKVVEAKRQMAQDTNAGESEDEDDDMGLLVGKETVMEIEKDNTLK
jgi:endonuclease III